jgi:NAD(P)-dependent dehydrogenase (short-subunit alcohol dehydrogenase family)
MATSLQGLGPSCRKSRHNHRCRRRIGRAVAALHAREGADIATVYLLEEDGAVEPKRIVEAEGRKAITISGDIGERAFADEIVARTLEVFGKIDIVVSDAGEQHPYKDITDISEDQLRRSDVLHSARSTKDFSSLRSQAASLEVVQDHHPNRMSDF